jgi:hypothetical protein
VSRVAIIDI